MYRTLLFAQLWCFLFLVSLNSSFSQSEAKLTLIESFPTGYRYSVRTAVQLAGQLTVPTGEGKSQVLAVSGESTIEYDERILPPLAQSPGVRTLRLYRTVQMKRKVGDKIQEASIRPEVRRLVILRQQQTEVPFSPDGPLTWASWMSCARMSLRPLWLVCCPMNQCGRVIGGPRPTQPCRN
jgi:hypothetical protein